MRVLTIIDQHSWEYRDLVVDTSLPGVRVARELTKLVNKRAKPNMIVSDNGNEFTSKASLMRAENYTVKWPYITLGCPMENGYNKSFNRSFRDECLNEDWFESLGQARQIISEWQDGYNNLRSHSSLGYETPISFRLRGNQQQGYDQGFQQR